MWGYYATHTVFVRSQFWRQDITARVRQGEGVKSPVTRGLGLCISQVCINHAPGFVCLHRIFRVAKLNPMNSTNTPEPCLVCPKLRGGVRVFLFLLLLPFATGASAMERVLVKDFVMHNWDTEDGLPSSRVEAVARTPDGYLWVATLNGLARFDGVRFVTFNTNNTPALGNNHISCLFVDREGALWVGTRYGLAKYQAGCFTAMNLRTNAPYVSLIRSIAQDAQGTLWIMADAQGGVLWLAAYSAEEARRQDGHTKVFDSSSGLPSAPGAQVVCNTTGRSWVRADEKLWELAQGGLQPPAGVPPLPQPVRAIALSRDGGLWVGIPAEYGLGNRDNKTLGDRGNRILKLKNRRWVDEQNPYPWDQDSLRTKVDFLTEDHSGRLWCATTGAGMFYRNPAEPWQLLTRDGALTQPSTAFCDQDGSIWVGTRSGGLHQMRPRIVTSLPVEPGTESNPFLTICVTRDGSLWGGTDGSGVLRWRNGTVTRYGAGQGLTNLQVAVLFEDRHTNLWAGTWGGLFRFNGERFEPVPGPPTLRGIVLALTEDRQGNLWAGTDSGLVRMHDGDARVFGKPEGLSSLFIRAVEEDRAGQIWVAVVGNGLFRLAGERFEHYAAGQWPGEKIIRALHADAGGALWIATEGAGLVRLKDGHFTQYTGEDGLPDDRLQTVLEDDAGNLWFGSDNGIFGCPRQTLEQYEHGRSPRLSLLVVVTGGWAGQQSLLRRRPAHGSAGARWTAMVSQWQRPGDVQSSPSDGESGGPDTGN